MKRPSATQRFHSETRRRKASPPVLLLGGVGVVFLAVVGFILFGGGEPEELIRARFDELTSEGAGLQMRGRLDEADAKYREAIEVAGGREMFRTRVVDLKARLREIAGDRKQLREARGRFDEWRARVDRRKPGDVAELCHQGRRLLSEVERAGVPWQGELKAAVGALEAERERGRIPSVEETRKEIADRFRLADPAVAHDWSGVVQAWQDHRARLGPEADRKRVDDEMGKVHLWARQEFDGVRRRAQRRVESGEKGEAIEAIDKERPRFERTPSLADLEKLRADLNR